MTSKLFQFAVMVILAMGPELRGADLMLAAVVHKSYPYSDMLSSRLKAILALTVPRWPDNSKVVVVAQEEQSPVRQFIYQRILRTTSLEMKRQSASREFAGEETVIVRVLNSDAAACKFVSNVPSAIALID